jgi:hypothetical protein
MSGRLRHAKGLSQDDLAYDAVTPSLDGVCARRPGRAAGRDEETVPRPNKETEQDRGDARSGMKLHPPGRPGSWQQRATLTRSVMIRSSFDRPYPRPLHQ